VQVYASSTNILQEFQVGHFSPSGKYYNPLGPDSVDGKGVWVVETKAVPQHVHACPAYLKPSPKMSQCTAIKVAYLAGTPYFAGTDPYLPGGPYSVL
jgi:hypothetical protein